MGKNKVHYGIKNAHWALKKTAEDGTITYAAPVSEPGIVALDLDPEGDSSVFYADDVAYFTSVTNAGYSGDAEFAKLSDEFGQQCLGDTLDADSVQVENADAKTAEFALLFEFEGDVKNIRHVIYNCKAQRPKISGNTTEDKTKPDTDKLSITASPLTSGNKIVKSHTTDTTTETVYNSWYTAVHMPSTTKTGA